MNHKCVIIASPHGFCAGVRRAVEITEATLQEFPPPIYCLHELVHNRQVVEDLAGRGVVFVRTIGEVPRGATVLFSAHGVSPAIRLEAERAGLRVIDATCPFVTKVHAEVRRYAAEGYTILLIGHPDHDEVAGVVGEAPDHVVVIQNVEDAAALGVPAPDRVAVVTQTTLSVAETERVMEVLRARFPRLRTPAKSDICYATTNRQRAVEAVAAVADAVLVLGSENSSNSKRLVEVARSAGVEAFLISTLAALEPLSMGRVRTVGVTAGASTPESFVHDVVSRLRARGFDDVSERRVADETVHFRVNRDAVARPGS